MIVYFSADLMSGSKVQGPAQAADISLKTVGSARGCLELVEQSSDSIDAVIVDLNPPARDAVQVITQLKQIRPNLRIVAHGPHVQTGMLGAAREAGAEVLTNGQFHQQVHDVLRQLAQSADSGGGSI